MAPHSLPLPRSPTLCDCSWQGDPIHDENPMRFHMETGLGEDEFRAFHSIPRTRCVRHTYPTRSRRVSYGSSSTESEAGTDDQEHALRRSNAPSPARQERPSFLQPESIAIAETVSMPLTRECDASPPRPHPAWLRGSSVSLSGLHRGFPSTEDLWAAGQRSRADSAASANHRHTRSHYQRPALAYVAAQSSQTDLERRQIVTDGVADNGVGTVPHNINGQRHEPDELEAAAEIVAGSYRQYLENNEFPEYERPPTIWEFIASVNEGGRQPTRQNGEPPSHDTRLIRHLSGDTDAGSDSTASPATDLDDHEPGNFHFTNLVHGDDDLSTVRGEMQAQLRYLDASTACANGRRRDLDAARHSWEHRLTRLDLRNERGGSEMLDDGF